MLSLAAPKIPINAPGNSSTIASATAPTIFFIHKCWRIKSYHIIFLRLVFIVVSEYVGRYKEKSVDVGHGKESI